MNNEVLTTASDFLGLHTFEIDYANDATDTRRMQ